MPNRAEVRIIELRKWFPPDDPLAAQIARICILREDLLLEMQGICTVEIKELDEHSTQFRRTYFVRNLVRTLTELSSAIQRLLGNPQFKAILEEQSDEVKATFADAAPIIGRAQPIVKDVRNDVSGHVRESAVQKALEKLGWDVFGLLDMGPTESETHYKFAEELIWAILYKDVTREELRNRSSKKFGSIRELLHVFSLVESCFMMYAEDRGLLPRGH